MLFYTYVCVGPYSNTGNPPGMLIGLAIAADGVEVNVNLHTTHLRLLTTAEGNPGGIPLATMDIPGTVVDYKYSASGVAAAVAIPQITVRDMRPSTPDNSRVVMSTSSGSKAQAQATGER
eukprot:scaffold260406_cov18-Prasinocladus_malaysianus.AAC.2